MKFSGINKRIDHNDLTEDLSPDTSNAYLYKGQAGLLGPRAGKTFFNSTAYDDNVNAILPFYTPSRRKWLVCDSNGAVTQRDQAFSYPALSSGLTRKSAFLATPLSLTLTAGSTTTNTTDTFATALPAMTGNKLVGFFLQTISTSINQTNPITDAQVDVTVSLGLVTSVGGTRWHQAWTVTYILDVTGNYTNDDINMVPPHERIGNRLIIGSAYQAGDGTITGIGIKIDAVWSGIDAGSTITIGSLSGIVELD